MNRVQYTIRNIPTEIDQALRTKARKNHESLNETLIAALEQSVQSDEGLVEFHDLDFIAGSWVEDAGTAEVLQQQRQIDKELWK